MAENPPSSGQKSPAEILQSVRKVLLSMPHLRKVNTLRFGDQMGIDLLTLVNELLLELEVLEIQCANDNFSTYSGDVINFKLVSHLTVHISGAGTRSIRVPLTFDRLEHLVLNGYSRHSQKWTEFIIQNKSLRTLVLMPGHCAFADENMDQNLMVIAAQLPKLAELFVYGDFISSPNRLKQFIAETTALVKLHLRFLCASESVRQAFITAMGSDWHVTEQLVDHRCNDLIFERCTHWIPISWNSFLLIGLIGLIEWLNENNFTLLFLFKTISF